MATWFPHRRSYLLQLAGLATCYAAAALVGLALAIPPGNATAVWLPSGIAAGGLLLGGYRLWPGVLLGATLGAMSTSVAWPLAFFIGGGNTLEALCASWLVRRRMKKDRAFQRVQDAFLFACATMASCVVAATAGAGGLLVGGYIGWAEFPRNWWTWWLGDVAGMMIVVPLMLRWAQRREERWSKRRWAEAALLLILLAAATHCIFGGWLPERSAHDILYLPLLFLVWACLRFGLAEVTAVVAVFAVTAVHATWWRAQTYGSAALHTSLFDLQIFINVYALVGLALGALATQRRDADAARERSLHELQQQFAEQTAELFHTIADLRAEVTHRTRAEHTLRESQQHFQTLFECAGDALFLLEINGRILDANQCACDSLRYVREELVGMNLSDIQPDGMSLELLAVCDLGQPATVEAQYRRKDGSCLPVEIRAGLIRLAGQPHLLLMARDTSDRKRLQELEQLRFTSVLESIGEGILITEADGTIRYANSAFERISGYSCQELVGNNPRLLQSGLQEHQFYEKLWSTITAGGIWRGSFTDKRKEGDLYDVDTTIAPIRDALGSVFGYVAVSRDVTEQRRSAQALRESEARMRAIFNAAVDGIITINETGLIESCNPAMERIFGYTQSELAGRNVRVLMPPPYRQKHDTYLARYLQTGQRKVIGSRLEVNGRRKDGSTFPMDLTVSEVWLGDRRLFTGIVRDVTDRHARQEAERALLQTEAKLNVARTIQQRFYPSAPPLLPGFDVGGGSYPAEAAGGDYFDYLPLPDGCVLVVIADVSGHGLGPALVMSETRAYLRALSSSCSDVSELATRLNCFFTEDVASDKFVTLFLVRIDPRDRSLVYASAGHRCYLLRAAGEVEALSATGLPLGMVTQQIPAQAEIAMQPGDILLLLTDGGPETQSPAGRFFGIKRALRLVRAKRHLPAQQIVESLYQATRRFAAHTPQQDDITTVAIKSL